ncbi:MAG: putative glycosyltransferase [Phycisphaerales bacterium]|nr:putative glycosyltransferase [Phycisphaerales bacterium]
MIPRRYILIFHQAALGDFVMTWPLAMALGRVFAQSRVMYVTGVDKGQLAEAVLGVESLSADSGWHALHGTAETTDERMLRMLKGTQCVVLFAQNEEAVFVENIRKYAGDDVPLILIQPNPPAGIHVMAHQLAQLGGNGKLNGYVEQMQTLVRTAGLANSGGAKSGVLIHPGSGSSGKNWPIELFLKVATLLSAAGETVTFVLGEVEREKWDAKAHAALRAAAKVIEPADLSALRAALTRSAAFIGNDSGPTHLAAMLGLRTVAMFGPASSPEQWHPVGPRVTVLPFDSLAEAVVSAVAAMA